MARVRYLVTGGAGFIGSHLVERLLADGEVAVIDNLSTGAMRNIEHLKSNPRFHYTIDSIFNEPVTAELVDQADVIFHLAASVGVMRIVSSPVDTIETNIRGTQIVLRNAAKKRKPVLLASTSEVYGKAGKVPFNEEDDVTFGPSTKVRWSYGCSKLIDEYLALSYWKERKLPIVVARLFNTVGPRQSGAYGMVIPRLVDQALHGGPLTVFGDGTQTRCFAHIGDVVEALIRLAREPKAAGRIFNVGSDEEIGINTLAERIRDKVDPKLLIRHVPYEQAYERGFEDLKRRVPDLAKIRALLGFESRVTLDQILDDVIRHERQKEAKP